MPRSCPGNCNVSVWSGLIGRHSSRLFKPARKNRRIDVKTDPRSKISQEEDYEVLVVGALETSDDAI